MIKMFLLDYGQTLQVDVIFVFCFLVKHVCYVLIRDNKLHCCSKLTVAVWYLSLNVLHVLNLHIEASHVINIV